MKTLRLLSLLFFATLTTQLLAQEDDVEYRMELGGAAGVNFSLTDVNSKWYGNTQIAGGALARFIINPRMAVKTSFTYGKLSGSASDVKNFYPSKPGELGTETLDFKADGDIYDLSAIYELHFLPYGYVEGYQGFKRIVPYIQAGLGLSYGSAGKAFTANIPLGFGVKYKIAPRLNLGFEWRMHLSLSDKLENLEAPLGIKSTGFKNKDHYSLTLLSITYDLAPRCPNCNKD